MPSSLDPHYNIHHLHDLLLGFSSFVVLCGIKATQLMRQQGHQRRAKRAIWDDSKVHLLIDLLLERKAKIGQSGSFPTSIFAKVACSLAADKDATNVHTKFQALKKKYRAIETYKNSSGRGQWSIARGADVSDTPEDGLAWDQFISTSVDGKELASHRNTGWPFYLKMEALLSESSTATGCRAYTEGFRLDPALESTAQADKFEDDEESEQNFTTLFSNVSGFSGSTHSLSSQSMLRNAGRPEYDVDLDLDRLLDIGRDITSPDRPTQLAAIHSAVSVLSPSTSQSRTFSSESGNRTFSDTPYPRPPSTRTSVMSSAPRISTGKSRARKSATPARSLSVASSAIASSAKRSKVTHAESSMANAATLTGMTGALNRATDCMKGLLAPTGSPPASMPPTISPQPLSFRSLATAHLNADIKLNINIRAELALEFLTNDSFCQMYAELTDPVLRENFALGWYQKKHNASTSFPSAPSSSVAAVPPPTTFPSNDVETGPALYGDGACLAGPSIIPSSTLFSGIGNPPTGVGNDVSLMDYDNYYDTSYMGASDYL